MSARCRRRRRRETGRVTSADLFSGFAVVGLEIKIKADVISRSLFHSEFKTHTFTALYAGREIFTCFQKAEMGYAVLIMVDPIHCRSWNNSARFECVLKH